LGDDGTTGAAARGLGRPAGNIAAMADDDIAVRMMEALQDAPSLQLYQMRALIDGLLAQPQRTVAARAALHLGQAVQFIDHRTGQVRRGKLIARHDSQATVLEEDVRRTWKIPYVAIEGAPAAPGAGAKPYEPPPEPAMPRGQSTLHVGDKVTFDDAKGTAQVGIVTRINRRTATLEAMDGRTWRVDFQLLRHVVEV
tara:strand:+ start:1103 stop:1693 length:591 start_codon:yes stop_codon:yes gene_type:complete